MALRVSMHLRDGENKTNLGAVALATGLELAGAEIVKLSRTQPLAPGADIMLQTGFGGTVPIRQAIAEGIPYLMAEAPAYRHLSKIVVEEWVSYGWGGLMGGAYHTPAPSIPRWAPELKPMKTSGATIIFAQKRSDHSLRGVDHDVWLREMLALYPEAEFRPHPLMCPPDAVQEPIRDVLKRCYQAITYTSTAGAEALIEGCVSNAAHPGSSAYRVKDRREWLHQLSWQNFPMVYAATRQIGKHILEGYEMAKWRAEVGLQEHPREKLTEQMWQYNIDDPRVRAAI